MHILVYSDVSGLGGSEVLVVETVRAAVQVGAEVEVFAVPGGGLERLLAESPDLSAVTRKAWPFRPAGGSAAPAPDAAAPPMSPPVATRRRRSPVYRLAGFLRSALRWRTVLRQCRPDTLFINLNGWEAIALGARLAGVPRIIGCYHLSVAPLPGGPLNRPVGWLLQFFSAWSCHQIVHTSEVVRRQWSRRTGFPRGRTRVILNGVEPGHVSREEARRALGWRPDQIVFCIPARLDSNKGHAVALEALARVSHTVGDVRLMLCGEGPELGPLQEQAVRRGIGRLVEFLGWRRDLPTVLAASDCVLLPSLHSENLSVAVLEAMMAGVPAIVSDIGGMTEAIEDGKSGWVVPARRPDVLAGVIAEAAGNPAERTRRGARAREQALERFTKERMLADYRRLLDPAREGAA